MQNSQEINWWLEILKLVPSFVTGLVALVIPIISYLWLQNRFESFKLKLQEDLEGQKTRLQGHLETYKASLQNDLESHKAKLKAEYDLRQFEFQQRFSLLHQEKVSVTKEMFELLVDLETSLKNENTKKIMLEHLKGLGRPLNILPERQTKILEEQKETRKRMLQQYNNVFNFFKKKRIFLDLEICENLSTLQDKIAVFPFFYFLDEEVSSDNYLYDYAKEKLEEFNHEEIKHLLNLLESQFRQLISAENPNTQIEKKI